MTEVAYWWVNTVQVQTYLGTGERGDTWADAVPVKCWVEESIDTVDNGTGTQTVSTSTRVYGPIDSADLFTPRTKVTLPSGRPARVITSARFDSGTLQLGVDHFVAALT